MTISSSCLPKPGHQTESLVQRLHFTIPLCPPWILSRISSLINDWIMTRGPLRRSPRTWEISPLELQYGPSELRNFWIMSGHLSLQYSKSFLQIGPSFCAAAISSKRLSEAGSWSRMFSTYSSISSSCLTCDVDFKGARYNASAVVSSLPGTWEIVESNRKRPIRNPWILGDILSRFFVSRSSTRGLWPVSMWNVLPIK